MGGRGGRGGTPSPSPQNGPNAPAAPTVQPGSPNGPSSPGSKPKQATPASPGGVVNPQGGTNNPGDGGSTVTPAPNPQTWYSAYRRKADNDQSTLPKTRLDTITVNPRWEEPGNAYKENCTRCSATWEMRQRGYDVTAGAMNFAKRDWYDSDIYNKWRDANGNQRQGTLVATKIIDAVTGQERYVTNDEWLADLETRILAAGGEGSRGFIRLNWSGGGGHIFNYRVRNGKVEFIEAQAQPLPWQETYEKYIRQPGWHQDVDAIGGKAWFMRVDDLEPQKLLLDDKWVLGRTSLEINAPTFDEMIDQYKKLYPDVLGGQFEVEEKRRAFRQAWQQLRSGRRPRIPNNIKDVPDLAEAYRLGIEWARRPD